MNTSFVNYYKQYVISKYDNFKKVNFNNKKFEFFALGMAILLLASITSIPSSEAGGPPPTSLQITKVSSFGDDTFDFIVTGPTSFNPSINTVGGTGMNGPTAVNPGTYSVQETIPAGWDLTTASCNDGSSTFSVDTVSGIVINSGDNIECTFENIVSGLTVPDQVTGLVAIATGTTTIDLTWTMPADGGLPITGYQIERESPISGGFSILVADTGSTSTVFVDTGLTPDTQYNYRVSAINAVGIGFASNEAFATTFVLPSTLKITKLTIGGDDTFDFIVTGPTSFNPSINTVGGTGMNGPTAVNPGTYSVQETIPAGWDLTTASCNDGSSTFSVDTVSGIVINPGDDIECTFENIVSGLNVPEQVTGLVATANSVARIDLTWTMPADGGLPITGYQIERESPISGGFSILVADTGSTSTVFVDTGLTPDTQYNYRVSAINAVGIGTASSEADATTFMPQEPTLIITHPIGSESDHFGEDVASADVNNDGFDDFIIGDSEASTGGIFESGSAFIFLGPDFTSSITLVDPNPIEQNDFGESLATGDINNDGNIDIIVGSPGTPNSGAVLFSGEVFVYFGPNFSTVTTLTESIPERASDFGRSVASGDVNNDGFDDVIIGVSGADAGGVTSSGEVYVYLGPSIISPTILTAPVLGNGDSFGHSVATGDVNNDGFDDIVAGTPGADVGTFSQAGKTFVFFGPDFTSITSLTQPPTLEDSSFGGSVATGDINNDGFDEVIVGAISAFPDGTTCDVGPEPEACGEVYVFQGPALTTVTKLHDPTVQGSARFGDSVASGDINNDGFDEVIVGAPGSTVNGIGVVGETFVFLGPSLLTVNTLSQPTTIASEAGFSVASGDINNDGLDDVLVGARQFFVSGFGNVGAAYYFESIPSILNNPPGQVTGLVAVATSTTTIDLAWVAPVDNGGSPITGYKIERESPIGGGFVTIVPDTGSILTIFSDIGLTESTQYNYKVSAINAIGIGPASNEADATTFTPQEAADDLIDDIDDLIDDGTLTGGQGNALISKLENIIDKINNGQISAACNQLDSFINQVNAFINGGTLTPAEGQPLLDAAQAIKDAAGC